MMIPGTVANLYLHILSLEHFEISFVYSFAICIANVFFTLETLSFNYENLMIDFDTSCYSLLGENIEKSFKKGLMLLETTSILLNSISTLLLFKNVIIIAIFFILSSLVKLTYLFSVQRKSPLIFWKLFLIGECFTLIFIVAQLGREKIAYDLGIFIDFCYLTGNACHISGALLDGINTLFKKKRKDSIQESENQGIFDS